MLQEGGLFACLHRYLLLFWLSLLGSTNLWPLPFMLGRYIRWLLRFTSVKLFVRRRSDLIQEKWVTEGRGATRLLTILLVPWVLLRQYRLVYTRLFLTCFTWRVQSKSSRGCMCRHLDGLYLCDLLQMWELYHMSLLLLPCITGLIFWRYGLVQSFLSQEEQLFTQQLGSSMIVKDALVDHRAGLSGFSWLGIQRWGLDVHYHLLMGLKVVLWGESP